MDERHAEALDDPYDIEDHRERALAVITDHPAGGLCKAHDEKRDEGYHQAAGNGPLAPDFFSYTACRGEAYHGSETAGNRENHCGAGL